MATSHLSTFAPPAASLLGAAAQPLQLRFLGGDQAGQVFAVPSSKCTIGAAPTCTLHLPVGGVEPKHALILHGAQATAVRSLAAPVLVNGVPVQEATLDDGDRLVVGSQEFEVVRPIRSSTSPIDAQREHEQDELDNELAPLEPTAATQAQAAPDDAVPDQTELVAVPAETGPTNGSDIAQLGHRVDALTRAVQANTELARGFRDSWQADRSRLEVRLSDSSARITELDQRLNRFPQEAVHELSRELSEATHGLKAAVDELRGQLADLRRQLDEQVKCHHEDQARRSADWKATDQKLQNLVHRIDELRTARGAFDESTAVRDDEDVANDRWAHLPHTEHDRSLPGHAEWDHADHATLPRTRNDLFDRLTRPVELERHEPLDTPGPLDIASDEAVMGAPDSLEPARAASARHNPFAAAAPAPHDEPRSYDDTEDSLASGEPLETSGDVFAPHQGPCAPAPTPYASGSPHAAPVSTAEVLARLAADPAWAEGGAVDEDDTPAATMLTGSLHDSHPEHPEHPESVSGEDAAPSAYAESGFHSEPVVCDAPPSPYHHHGDESDESIEAYMNQLLARVRGNKVDATASEPVAVATNTNAEPDVRSTPRDEIEHDPLPEPAPDFQPRGEDPRIVANLAAMRELANDSARSAIAAHAKSNWIDMAKANLIGAVAGLVGAGLSLFYIRTSITLALLGVTAGLATTAWLGWRALQVRRRLFHVPQAVARSHHEDAATAEPETDCDVATVATPTGAATVSMLDFTSHQTHNGDESLR